jgi:hypothetical protein
MDTTVTVSPSCNDKYLIYYFHVDGSYPVATQSILADSKAYLNKTARKYIGSGYITFRFMINCEGKMQWVRVMQVDEDYKTTHFDKLFVSDLNDYIHTLHKWKTGLSAFEQTNVNYIAYISFRIKNGEIVNVIY